MVLKRYKLPSVDALTGPTVFDGKTIQPPFFEPELPATATVIKVAIIAPLSDTTTANGLLMTVKLQIPSDRPTTPPGSTLPLDLNVLDRTLLVNDNGEVVPVSFNNGSLRVRSGTVCI